MTDFLAALGLMLALEGLVLAGVPTLWRQAVASLLAGSDTTLRAMGLTMAVIGVFLVYLVRS